MQVYHEIFWREIAISFGKMAASLFVVWLQPDNVPRRVFGIGSLECLIPKEARRDTAKPPKRQPRQFREKTDLECPILPRCYRKLASGTALGA
jgi:hypothetical protein